jgi:hypothetical protein
MRTQHARDQDELRQRIINGDEQALDELMDRLAQARKAADEAQKRADDLRRELDELQSRSYVYNLTNRCMIQYIQMRPCYMTC